jgi:hypothetical protein
MGPDEQLPKYVYDDDENHPLSYLDKIDVAIELKNGGYYAVVAAQPLKNEPRTRARLIRKLENYRNDFFSERFREKNGPPLRGKLLISMKMHSGSDQGIYDLLEDCRAWLAESGIELEISKIKSTVN